MIPKSFTVADIDELVEAKNKIFKGPYPIKIYSELIQNMVEKSEWQNSTDLAEDLLGKITKTNNLNNAGKILADWKTEIREKPLDATQPQKEQLETLEKDLEAKKIESAESKEKVEQDVEKFKQRAEKIYLQSKTETPEIQLDNNDVIVLENLSKSASSDPKTFVNDLSQTINQKTGVDIESGQIAALDLYERMATQTQSTPPEVFITTASHFDSEELREAALVFGKLAEENNNQLREIFTPILGKNLTETFYPSSPREFEVTSERTNKTLFEIDPEKLVKDYKEVNPFNALDKIKEAGRDHVKSLIFQKIESLPAKSAIRGIVSKTQSSLFFRHALPFLGLSAPAEVVATSFVGKSIEFLFPKFAPIIASFGAKLGINIGIKTVAPAVLQTAGTTAIKTVGNTLGKAAVGILAKMGISGTASFVPGLNIAVWGITILSLLKDLGKLIKELGPKIKRWLSDNAPIFVGIGALGLLLGNPLIAGLGVVSISAGLLSGASLAKLGARTGFFFGRIFSSMAITIATPVIVTIIVFPVLVAIILFIINSGAYIVPPSSSLRGNVESPYVGIEKTATPDCLNRPGCPGFGNVTYKVRIWAKKGILNNVLVQNKYTVVGEGNPTITSPAIGEIQNQPMTISPSKDLIFTYNLNIDSSYDNSIIVDQIIVTADTDSESGIMASGDASVIVGNPPISCPITNPSLLYPSYNPNVDMSHGSDYYWNHDNNHVAPYTWPIPQTTGCFRPGDCPFYGYALDVFPSSSNEVIAPTVLGQNVTWVFNGISFPNGGGASGHSFGYTDSTGKYTLLITHVSGDAVTTSVASGGRMARLFPHGNDHLHMEFQVNGQYQKPENFFCR